MDDLPGRFTDVWQETLELGMMFFCSVDCCRFCIGRRFLSTSNESSDDTTGVVMGVTCSDDRNRCTRRSSLLIMSIEFAFISHVFECVTRIELSQISMFDDSVSTNKSNKTDVATRNGWRKAKRVESQG